MASPPPRVWQRQLNPETGKRVLLIDVCVRIGEPTHTYELLQSLGNIMNSY